MTYNIDSKYTKLSYCTLKLVKVILAFVQIGMQSLAQLWEAYRSFIEGVGYDFIHGAAMIFEAVPASRSLNYYDI